MCWYSWFVSRSFSFFGRNRLTLTNRFLSRWFTLDCYCYGLQNLRLLARCWSRGVVWMLVGSAGFLLFLRVQSKRESLSTLLVVSGLRNLFPWIDVWIVILVDTCGGWGAWLDDNWVHILNLRYVDVLLSIFARLAAVTHRLWRIRAVATAAAAHKCCIVSELKTFVRFPWADRALRANLSTGKPLLEFGRAIQSWATALNLLLGLLCVADALSCLRVGWNRISHLRGSGLLSGGLMFDRQMCSPLRRRFHACRGTRNWVRLLLLLPRVIAQTFCKVLTLLIHAILDLWWSSDCSLSNFFSC